MADPQEHFHLTVDQDGLQLRQQAPHFVLTCFEPNYSSGSFALFRENDVQVTGTYTRTVIGAEGAASTARQRKPRPARRAAKKSAAKKTSKKGARKASKKVSKPKRRR